MAARYQVFLGLIVGCWLNQAVAQDAEQDELWRVQSLIGAQFIRGNSNVTSANVRLEGIREDVGNKLFLRTLYNLKKVAGKKNTDERSATAQYDADFLTSYFVFVRYEINSDKPKNNKLRNSLSSGVGTHLIEKDNFSFDVGTGLGLSNDQYVKPVKIDNRYRRHIDTMTYNLNQLIEYDITKKLKIKQSLIGVYEFKSKAWRTDVWLDISYLLSNALSLNLGLNYQHNSKVLPGNKKGDSSANLGISYIFN